MSLERPMIFKDELTEIEARTAVEEAIIIATSHPRPFRDALLLLGAAAIFTLLIVAATTPTRPGIRNTGVGVFNAPQSSRLLPPAKPDLETVRVFINSR